MADNNGQKDGLETTAQDNEPKVSKPYIMPDDPEEGSAEALAKELAEARDRTLRTLAEMENLRKRTTREVADARIYGITGFARDVLDIADSLQRALDAVPAEAKAAADPGLKALIEGVELTERSLLNTLEKNGVKKFDPMGERFRRWSAWRRVARRRHLQRSRKRRRIWIWILTDEHDPEEFALDPIGGGYRFSE
jgi:molecular chaperone GrpE